MYKKRQTNYQVYWYQVYWCKVWTAEMLVCKSCPDTAGWIAGEFVWPFGFVNISSCSEAGSAKMFCLHLIAAVISIFIATNYTAAK